MKKKKENPILQEEEKYHGREEVIDKVTKLAESLCESEGMELVHVEYQKESAGRIIRVYIDRETGVNIDDCMNISKQLGVLLDVNINTYYPYNLEVSSPGFDRPLGKLKDFERFKGKTAKIKTEEAVCDRKNFTGILSGVSQDIVKILVDGENFDIPHKFIVKARLVG
ncbi:MAG: ribosome maturation factor RimP [Desulfobacterales bacterium]|nr:ribosome maturation factor RimP [Desulfobacterales bacterium]MBF0395823.1 ribosome maturation factor RimP [Desulfobacterales bacterium]